MPYRPRCVQFSFTKISFCNPCHIPTNRIHKSHRSHSFPFSFFMWADPSGILETVYCCSCHTRQTGLVNIDFINEKVINLHKSFSVTEQISNSRPHMLPWRARRHSHYCNTSDHTSMNGPIPIDPKKFLIKSEMQFVKITSIMSRNQISTKRYDIFFLTTKRYSIKWVQSSINLFLNINSGKFQGLFLNGGYTGWTVYPEFVSPYLLRQTMKYTSINHSPPRMKR